MPFCGLRICFSTSLKTVVNLDKSFQYCPSDLFWYAESCWIILIFCDWRWDFKTLKLRNGRGHNPAGIRWTLSFCGMHWVWVWILLNIWISAYDCQSWNTNPEVQHRTCEKHDSIKMVLYVSTCIDNNNSKHDKYELLSMIKDATPGQPARTLQAQLFQIENAKLLKVVTQRRTDASDGRTRNSECVCKNHKNPQSVIFGAFSDFSALFKLHENMSHLAQTQTRMKPPESCKGPARRCQSQGRGRHLRIFLLSMMQHWTQSPTHRTTTVKRLHMFNHVQQSFLVTASI